MRILGVVMLAAVLPLAGCVGTGAGGNMPQALEDLPENYIVFFPFNSAVRDETAQGVIAQAADDTLRHRATMIEIAGFSGAGPNVRTCPQIANQRFSAVEEALAARELDTALFERVGLMDDPNLSNVAIRRIEIRLELP